MKRCTRQAEGVRLTWGKRKHNKSLLTEFSCGHVGVRTGRKKRVWPMVGRASVLFYIVRTREMGTTARWVSEVSRAQQHRVKGRRRAISAGWVDVARQMELRWESDGPPDPLTNNACQAEGFQGTTGELTGESSQGSSQPLSGQSVGMLGSCITVKYHPRLYQVQHIYYWLVIFRSARYIQHSPGSYGHQRTSATEVHSIQRRPLMHVDVVMIMV